MNEEEFARRVQGAGGNAYIVGGWVRDHLRGSAPKDKDYVIAGIAEPIFYGLFPDATKIGKAFPVYLVKIDEKNAEVAFARKEKKNGGGYRGFSVTFAPNVTIEEDLYRRDTTMNSMAISLKSGKLFDPYGGAADIENRVIRATSGHFLEDPVRALRAARQAAETGFRIAAETIALMRCCRTELAAEPKERVLAELTKALHSVAPSAFFYALRDADLLANAFAQIYSLIGQTQPTVHHPEGDAFVHSMQVLDAAAMFTDRVEVRFAALVHDLGKGLTKKEALPHHHGHEKAGLDALRAFDEQMTLPRRWLSCAAFAIAEHMRVSTLKKPAKIVDFLLRLEKNPIGADGFGAVVQADHGTLPEVLRYYERALQAIHSVNGRMIPQGIKGKDMGVWLRQKQIFAYKRECCSEGSSLSLKSDA